MYSSLGFALMQSKVNESEQKRDRRDFYLVINQSG